MPLVNKQRLVDMHWLVNNPRQVYSAPLTLSVAALLLLLLCFGKRGVQKEGDLNEAVEHHQWCRLLFHKIGNLNGAFAPSFKYTDVVRNMF